MNGHFPNFITLRGVLLLTLLICAIVHAAPTDLKEIPQEGEETDSKQQESDVTHKEPNEILSEDNSKEVEEAIVDSTDANDIQQPEDDAGGEAVPGSDEGLDESSDYSFFNTRQYDESVEKYSYQTSDYTSSYSEQSYDANLPQESSFSKPFFPQQNDIEDSFELGRADVDSGEISDEQSRRLQQLLCDVLDICSYDFSDDYPNYSSESAPIVLNNDIKVDTQPTTDDSDTDSKDSDNNEIETISRKKRSEKDESKHGHRAKRDLSWDMLNDVDDDTIPYTEELDFLTDVLSDGDDDTTNVQMNNLADVLDYIEGIRRDKLSSGDILEEFEIDEALGGLPVGDTDVAVNNAIRKRGLSPIEMKHYVQSLPTLEGMRKRNDLDEDFTNVIPRDFMVAAENELAAEELQNIETKAQVAAAMLDDAAMLIATIENMAVDLVGDYLGLNDEANDEDKIDYPVDFEEFPQYLPPVPPVSVEKRIGRQRARDYPAVYDYPFVPEDLERPFKGAFESISKPRYMGSSGVTHGSNFRRPNSRNTYRGLGRVVPPPFVGKHIGIFPSDDFIRPRYRRDRLPILDALLKQKRGSFDYEALPLIADDIPTEDSDVWEGLANESPRLFPIGNKLMGRFGPDGHPYIDGVFTPYPNADEDSLDRVLPLDNTLDRDIPLEDGLQEAFEAAAMMQDKIDRDNQLLEEQDNILERAADEVYVGNVLSNIFRERIK